MTSPRKFAEKIALIQQKQAEGDVAFKTIICEVGEAKQRVNRVSTTNCRLGVPSRTFNKPFEVTNYQGLNGMNNSDTNQNQNYVPQTIKIDNGNGCDRLLQPPDNASWRRTNSDSSLHYAMMPAVVAHYHANNSQGVTYETHEPKFEPSTSPSHPSNPHHFQVTTPSFPPHPIVDLTQTYMNDRSHGIYSTNPMSTMVPLAPTQSVPLATSNPPHQMLGPRYSGGSTGSNVLMLPPTHHPRGGSLPDLRSGNVFSPQQISFSTTPSPPTSTNQPHFFCSSSPQKNGDGDLYVLGPQQPLSSNFGPLKPSPSIRRRHSPIGEGKQASPRRQNSPSPDVSPNPQTMYRVEPSSPQSQSSYSPQNSPHLLASPGNDHSPFSPQQSSDSNVTNTSPYFTLPTHLDQITLDHNFYTQSQQQQQQQQQQSSSSPTSPTSVAAAARNSLPNDINGMQSNYFRPNNFYPTFVENMSTNYSQSQTSVSISTNVSQKSPTIPDIILTDVDSSKLDLSKDLNNDFSSAFDSLMDPHDLHLNNDDFLLNESDLTIGSHLCDGTFRMEN